MTPQELLLAAADLIHNAPELAKDTFGADAADLDNDGRPYQDGNLRQPTGNRCYCIYGALLHIIEFPEIRNRAREQLLDHLGLQCLSALLAWNDAPERTKEQVVQALREAAAR